MSTLHLYRAGEQPATRYRVGLNTRSPFWVTCHPRTQLWAMCCKRRRYARGLVVQVYYDAIYQWCKPGHGCKR